ncbi:hypothetical protein BGZ63DRAFT_399718 [Mariannaea sp. PMI_226]|nr:hypothetical protein BGZ63DRAFT_399718 [Mariannaea sp. PMI_226]
MEAEWEAIANTNMEEESEASGGNDDNEDDNASGIQNRGNGGSSNSGMEEPMEQLQAELEQRYKLDHIDQVLYTLAADINYIQGGEGKEEEETVCLLADHCQVAEQYHTTQEFTFYPLNFYYQYRNFLSTQPSRFLNNIYTIM